MTECVLDKKSSGKVSSEKLTSEKLKSDELVMSEDLIAGKSCIVVAPSRYLRGRGAASAEFIQSFDLVVKTTDMCEMRDPIGELGHRCDVWYGMPGNASGWRVNLQALKKQGVKLMILQPCLEQYVRVWHEYVDWLKAQELPEGLEYDIADTEHYEGLIERFGSLPLSGMFAVFDLLRRGAKSVYAYGHDFYRTGYFFDADFQAKTQISDWHEMDQQMQAVWQLLCDEPRFDCDENLKYLLHEKFQEDFEQEGAFEEFVAKELSFFHRSFPFGKSALIRTCNIKWFSRILHGLGQNQSFSHLDVIVQSNVSEILSSQTGNKNQNKNIQIHPYEVGERFETKLLQNAFDFKAGDFDTAFIPYNGMELWTYLDVFEYFLQLKVKNVFLISLRGIIRRIEDLQNECDAIKEYLAQRNQFNQYVQRYDRRHCL